MNDANLNIDFPCHFDHRGRTAATGDDDHVRDLIEQFLFTSAGERVNRPDFGSGLQQMVFAPAGAEMAEALEFTVRAGLERWLGDLIAIEELEVTAREAALRVVLTYRLRRTGESRQETFERSATPGGTS